MTRYQRRRDPGPDEHRRSKCEQSHGVSSVKAEAPEIFFDDVVMSPGYGMSFQPSRVRTGSYSSNDSTRCAWTIFSHGDQAKMVKRPSCDATSATASC